MKLYVLSGAEGSQQDSLGDQFYWAGNSDTIDVDAVKLDDLVKERVTLLRIDTQSNEFHVLQGATALIDIYGVDIIYAEFIPAMMKANGEDPLQFLEWLYYRNYLLRL